VYILRLGQLDVKGLVKSVGYDSILRHVRMLPVFTYVLQVDILTELSFSFKYCCNVKTEFSP